MKSCQRAFTFLLILSLAVVAVFLVAGPAAAAGWFKAAAGVSGLAMDDINNENFRFYDYTVEGFVFPDLNSGFSLSFHLGYDLSPHFSLGFSWDRQYARVKGTDQDVTADLNLDANFFMGHLYWWPLQTGTWQLGAAAGMGLAVPDGRVEVTGPNNVNYGQGDTSGSSTGALEVMAAVNFAVSERSSLEVTAGWRDAKVKEFRYQGRPARKEDGTNLTLDYTGYTLKAGYKFIFGDL